MPVHFSTRCLVSVREPSCESIKIVSFATKKVNERPVVVSLEAVANSGLPAGKNEFSVGGGVLGLLGHAPAVALADDDAALGQDAVELAAACGR